MTVACSFLATLILCACDRFRWRRFTLTWSDYDDESGSENPEYRTVRWWQHVLLLILVVPLAVVIIPVAVGAVPAMMLYVLAARYRWFRRAVSRLLRQRGVVFSWLLSFFCAPPLLVHRLLRLWRNRARCA